MARTVLRSYNNCLASQSEIYVKNTLIFLMGLEMLGREFHVFHSFLIYYALRSERTVRRNREREVRAAEYLTFQAIDNPTCPK